MPRLKYVELYDLMPDRDPVTDAFVRSSYGVTELYSEALWQADIQGYRSMIRLFCQHHGRQSAVVAVRVRSARPDDLPFEMGHVDIPSWVGHLDAHARARLALNVVHEAVLRLAAVRGWDRPLLDGCYRHVMDNDLEYRWQSPWKASPGRRYEARATFRVPPDDDYGRVRLEVRRRGTDAAPHRSAEAIVSRFERTARTVQWASANQVTMTPYCGFTAGDHTGLVQASLHDGTWAFECRDDVSARQPAGEGINPLDGQDVKDPAIVVYLAEEAEPRVVSEESQRRPSAWGVSIVWMSSLYQPGGNSEFVDDGFGDDPEMGIQVGSAEPTSGWEDDSWLATEDVRRHPEWKAWLTEHLSRDDVLVLLQVDDKPRRKVVYSFSKKQQEHRFGLHLPVQEFLVTPERELIRQATCEVFAAVAAKLELPPPPPPVTTTFN